MSLLVIDVGNTQTAIGMFEGEVLTRKWRIATERRATADELRVHLTVLFMAEGLQVSDVTGVALACVVTRLSDAWMRTVSSMFGLEAVLCTAAVAEKTGLFDHDYPNPHEIGSDRVADAVAARALYGAPVVVVDFGTATNIEVVAKDGQFLGGVIAPGLETSADALFSHAAKLSSIALEDPNTFIGRSTTQAVQAGLVLGEAARTDGLLRRIFSQLGYEAKVIATGGLAPLISAHMDVPATVDSELTLVGLRLLFEAL